jgi:hypothetical protein
VRILIAILALASLAWAVEKEKFPDHVKDPDACAKAGGVNVKDPQTGKSVFCVFYVDPNDFEKYGHTSHDPGDASLDTHPKEAPKPKDAEQAPAEPTEPIRPVADPARQKI